MVQKNMGTRLTDDEPWIEVIDQPEDVVKGFDCCCKAFGEQIHDAIWIAMNPEWNLDGPEGRPRAAARMVEQVCNIGNNFLPFLFCLCFLNK